MAATETGDGHQRLATNQVSCVQVPGAVIFCKLLYTEHSLHRYYIKTFLYLALRQPE